MLMIMCGMSARTMHVLTLSYLWPSNVYNYASLPEITMYDNVWYECKNNACAYIILPNVYNYIFTKGSLYCDGALRTKGFTGEGVYGQSVIAIKSHSINPLFINMENLPKRIFNKAPLFGAAIVLIRNPRDALIAEWHRERTKRKTSVNSSNHILHTGREHFGRSYWSAGAWAWGIAGVFHSVWPSVPPTVLISVGNTQGFQNKVLYISKNLLLKCTDYKM